MQETLTAQYWKSQKPETVLHSMFFDRNLFMSLVPPGRIEMCSYLLEAGITPLIITENYFRSIRSGNIYQGLQVYAKKHKP